VPRAGSHLPGQWPYQLPHLFEVRGTCAQELYVKSRPSQAVEGGAKPLLGDQATLDLRSQARHPLLETSSSARGRELPKVPVADVVLVGHHGTPEQSAQVDLAQGAVDVVPLASQRLCRLEASEDADDLLGERTKTGV
jgi:hypothetical protein